MIYETFWENYGWLLQVCVPISQDFGGHWLQTLGSQLLQVHIRANFVGGNLLWSFTAGGVAYNRWVLVQV